MHSNYILSPELKEKIRTVPSSSEFGTEHAAVIPEHYQDDVKESFKNSLELAGKMQSYSAGLINDINSLLDTGKYPVWLSGGLVDSFGTPNVGGEASKYLREIKASLNDIALATGHFLTDDLLYHPETREKLNFRDYDFETELDFIMSMSAYGISEVRSGGWRHKSERFMSASGYEIEVGSNDHHDPNITFRDQKVGKIISPFGNFVDFKPETIDKFFQFSQQAEPNILGSLFSYITSQTDISKVFGENGRNLRSLFGYQANDFLLNEESVKAFMRNAQTPLNRLGKDIQFRLDLEHRLDGGIFLVNESGELEFRKCVGDKVSGKAIFTLSLEDAILMVEKILFLINKQSTYRTMPRTGYAFITQYFHKLGL